MLWYLLNGNYTKYTRINGKARDVITHMYKISTLIMPYTELQQTHIVGFKDHLNATVHQNTHHREPVVLSQRGI